MFRILKQFGKFSPFNILSALFFCWTKFQKLKLMDQVPAKGNNMEKEWNEVDRFTQQVANYAAQVANYAA